MASRNRGRKKPSLRDYSRATLTKEEKDALWDKIAKQESPIITAILGQALVEDELDQLLRPHFVKRDDETWEKLTDDRGPLSTFNSKIVAAHAFGICSDTLKGCLDTIRKIRNAFAHSRKPIDFSDALIVKELRAVPAPKGKCTLLDKELLNIRKADANSAWAEFTNLCFITEIELIKKMAKRTKAKTRRMSKRYRGALARALMDSQPKHQGFGSLGLLDLHSDDPIPPILERSRKTPSH